MCIIDCLSTIVFILPLHLDYTKVIILILWWRNFQLEYWRTFQLVSTAIDAAIEEVQGYLTKYDTGKIFAARGKERNPILLLFVKDIAAWHFCNICNAGVDIEMREKRYDRAIEWLRNNQNRQNPNLPAAPEQPGRQECRCCGEIAFGSNRKRDNHF